METTAATGHELQAQAGRARMLYRDETDKTCAAWFNQIKIGDTAQQVGFDPASATRYQNN